MQADKTVAEALAAIFNELELPWPEKLVIEEPKNPLHGDLSTNAALLLAKKAAMPPRELAQVIAKKLPEHCPQIKKVEIAGPGFCNLTFQPEFWQQVLPEIEKSGEDFGRSNRGGGNKTMVEYVSANPTGPLHVGHGRGAAVGDSVTRLLRWAGYDTATEYYLNDAGRQMRLLGESIWARAMQIAGRDAPFPKDGYKGDYIGELARGLLAIRPDLPDLGQKAGEELCQEFGQKEILDGIKKDLENFRCEHQVFFSEKSLVDNGSVARAFSALEKAGKSFEKDGALWFEAQSLGDDQNRVLRKSDGSLTYFATDIAYHHNKFSRGYEWLVDVWGADHHGYIPRMKAAITAMGEDAEKFNVLLIQLVSLLRNGQIVPMSTRAGEFVTLAEVLDEVGVDAARFMFLSRSCDSPLDFDLELAKKRTMDNPVYYVQYGHARVCALLRRAAGQGVELPEETAAEGLAPLTQPEDIALMRQLAAFESVCANAAQALAPHHISRYLLDLSAKLHSYYGKYTIIDADQPQVTLARLALLRSVRQVLRNGLGLLGVTAPETM